MLEEQWHIPSNLHITNDVIPYINDLLSFNKISNISIFIHSSIKVPGASLDCRPSGNQDIVEFTPLNEGGEAGDIALDEDSDPLELFFGLEFMDHAHIPCKVVNLVQLLKLIRPHEVIVVREIEALLQQRIKLTNSFEDLFPF